MVTIANKLQRVLDTKEDIRQVLVEEGKDVPTDMPFRLYPEVIKNNKLPGLVGMYMGKGYTNESMSKNPVWYDTSGNGNHIQLKNIAWKLDSGCGQYNQDFKLWRSNNPNIFAIKKISEKVEYKYNIPGNSLSVPGYIPINSWNNTKTKIKTGNKGLRLYRVYNVTSPILLISFGPNEIGIIPQLSDEELVDLKHIFCGPAIEVKAGEVFSFEQIPDYDGAICFDGVDDYGICETFPVFTKEKGYTVMALRSWMSRDQPSFSLISNIKEWNVDGAYMLEYKSNIDNYASSFGDITNISDIFSTINPLIYQTSTEYNGKTIKQKDSVGTNCLLLAISALNRRLFANYALYALAIFDHDTTVEERQPVIDYWKKEFPELFPDQAWTVTGKTNSDADRATIKNITGNGNDLVLTNFSFGKNSGYGLYKQNFLYLQNYTNGARAIGEVTNSKIHIIELVTKQNFIEDQKVSDNPSYYIKITGLQQGQSVRYGQSGVTVTNFSKDGTYLLSETSGLNYIGFGIEGVAIGEPIDITIEQIPDYEGYLVTDGVDDSIRSSKFYLDKDWTVVGDWEFINSGRSDVAGITKSPLLYAYNYMSGIDLYINSTTTPVHIKTKSLRAICSDGRVYDKDWNELHAEPGTILFSDAALVIGSNASGKTCTPLAFKNIGVYNNIIMNKEQCIRSYNYLQTVKNV